VAAFPTVPVVLLHSSYPYTQEAGYLATVYRNVYLDIGEVFPMVSRSGQETIVRQALELTPMSKILWSTDGHLQAETYWLANVQGREALEKIFTEMVQDDDLTIGQAIRAVEDILFHNSNKLYDLRLQPPVYPREEHAPPVHVRRS
jgi:predicted TIM-barrel fold metal-dependent hydrolase